MPIDAEGRWLYNCTVLDGMLRATAFTLLLLGVLSHPLALLCDTECAEMVGMGGSSVTPAPSDVQADLRPCCADSPQITKQWLGKPLPKVVKFGGSQPPQKELLTAGFSHPIHRPALTQLRGSPPVGASSQVLRV